MENRGDVVNQKKVPEVEQSREARLKHVEPEQALWPGRQEERKLVDSDDGPGHDRRVFHPIVEVRVVSAQRQLADSR